MRTEMVELTNLCMIKDGDEYLLQNRVKKDWQGYTFPGGHIEPGESIVQSAIREVKEETGLTLTKYKLRCLVTFVSDKWETEHMYVFTASEFEGNLGNKKEQVEQDKEV